MVLVFFIKPNAACNYYCANKVQRLGNEFVKDSK